MEHSKEIHDKVGEIDNKISKLLQWCSAMDERCLSHRKETDEVRRTVYGNPSKTNGLQFQVDRLLKCKNEINKWREYGFFLLKVLSASAIIAVVTFLLKLYKGG